MPFSEGKMALERLSMDVDVKTHHHDRLAMQ